MKSLMLLSVLLAFNATAETVSDDLTIAADESMQSPTLNIEGQYKVEEIAPTPAPVAAPVAAPAPQKLAPVKVKILSQSDRLKIYRERLEERNKIMVEKKMEQIRFQQEIALARKLEQSMNQTLKAIDSVQN
jgi:hypothetical protein